MSNNQPADKSPRTVLFYGMSGAGKGTQAKLLVEKLRTKRNTHFVDTGQLLRDYVQRAGTYGSAKMKETMTAGGLLPSSISSYMWSGVLLKSVAESDNVIFDGAARSLLEADLFDKTLKWLGRDYSIIILEIDAETAKHRAAERGEGRADDTADAMAKRLEWFREKTMPAIEHMSEQGANVYHIDGSPSIEQIHQDILSKLNL